MGRKSLRKGTKKNYRKLASGVEGALELEGDRSGSKQVTEDENGADDNDGAYQNTDENSDNNIDDPSSAKKDGDSDSHSNNNSDGDGEIAAARAKLKKLKEEREELKKKSKIDRINREKKEVEKSLRKLKEDRKGGRKEEEKLTVDSLRSMQDVVTKVDKLMDKKLDRKSLSTSDSDSTTSYSSDNKSTSTTSCSDSDDSVGKKGRSKKKKSSKKSKKSGKRRSGKSKRLTSRVKFPQEWPHSHLSLHFVSKDKKYEELSLAEFCAGFASILEMSSSSKREHRLSHFKELMYLATRYQWRCVLNYHAACLLEIECGRMRWGDNFQVMQNTTLAGGFLQNGGNRSNGNGASSMNNANSAPAARLSGSSGGVSSSASREEGIIFCRGYQRGLCQKTGDHYGNFYGQNRLLKHIFAKCWLRMRSLAVHPENSETCPLKNEL